MTTRYAKCRLNISLIASLHSSFDVVSSKAWSRASLTAPPSAPPTRSAVSCGPACSPARPFWSLSQHMIGTCHTFNPSDCFSSRLAPRHSCAFPTSILVYIANLSALTTITQQVPARPVPCPNARHQRVARCPKHARSHSRPLCYACNPPPVLRPPPSARLKFSPQQTHAQRSACPALPGRHRVRVT